MASYEDAIVCPKCGMTGKLRGRPIPDGMNRLHMIYCENVRCEWYDTPWNVTVRADGSVPDPQDFAHRQKTYMVSASEAERSRQFVQNYAAEIQELSLKGGRLNKPRP